MSIECILLKPAPNVEDPYNYRSIEISSDILPVLTTTPHQAYNRCITEKPELLLFPASPLPM